MNTRPRIFLVAGLFVIALSSFFIGRRVEEAALVTKRRAAEAKVALSAVTATPFESTYRELAVGDILQLPFTEFYEALRSAPREAREKWAAEIQAMPIGPRRTAALAAFYKLLVQFDPVWAANSAREIRDKESQDLALESVTGAAPGFALKDIATLFLTLPADPSDYRKYLEEVISDWVPIDPPAVAQFYDEHPELAEHGLNRDLITSWAAIDPNTAKEWLDVNMYAGDEIADFIMGWYLNNSRAATNYAVQHAEELASTAGLENLLSALYSDSKEEAKKFIEQLPNDELRNKAFRGFEFKVNFGTAEETGEPDLTSRAVADWMTEFPPAYWREHLGDVLRHWNHVPPQEIFSWIEQQPPGIRSAVAAEYKMPVGDKVVDVVSALLNYGNTDLRDQLLMALFRNSASDLNQMKEAIINSSLAAAQKKCTLEFAARAEVAIEEQRRRQKAADEDQGSEK